MPKGTKVCKVCGKEYPYCKNWSQSTTFRYQDVACSVECGAIYLERITASRAKNTETADAENETESNVVEEIKEIEPIADEAVVEGANEETSDEDDELGDENLGDDEESE